MSKASIINKEDDRSIDIIILIEITLPERNPTINYYCEEIWPSRTAALQKTGKNVNQTEEK